ncbi:TIGR02270 family protein [Myxococcaceae bacterium JPH2]|nr:TIGR02270 family protein [Myxococcaceae bacterium JPH2]
MEESFDEAAFLWSQRERSLQSPDFTLPDIAAIEERLRARLDLLILGGAPVGERLLHPALVCDEQERISVTALALLTGASDSAVKLLIRSIQEGTEPQRAAICRALELCERRGIELHLMPLLQQAPPKVSASVLDVLTARRVRPDCSLEQLFEQGEPVLQEAVFHAAARVPQSLAPSLLTQGLVSRETPVRNAALEAGLVLGHRAAWTACVELVSRQDSASTLAMLALALGGSSDEFQRLLGTLAVPELRKDALWALGFSGRRAAAEACLTWMREDTLCRIAGEAFTAITGLSLEGEFAIDEPPSPEELIPLEEEDLDADLVPSPDERLPHPNVEAINRWWQKARAQLDPDIRHFRGKPFTPGQLLEQLRHGGMRRRPVLALELAIRTHGEHRVSVRALTDHQRQELELVRHLPEGSLNRPFTMTSGPTGAPASAPRAPPRRSLEDRTASSSSRSAGLAVTALGMVSSIGGDVVSSCAASRAGILRITELDTLQQWDAESEQMQPAKGHTASTLTRGFLGMGRLARLGAAALEDLTTSSGEKEWAQTGLFIALPSSFYLSAHEQRVTEQASREPGAAQEAIPLDSGAAEIRRLQYEQMLVPVLLRQSRLAIPHDHCRLFFGDQLGFIRALRAAEDALARGTLNRCIVGGIDSLVEPLTLEALDNLQLLRSPTQPAKMLPGEGAAFVLVEKRRTAEKRGATIHAWLGGAREARDDTNRLAGSPWVGRALAEVLQASIGEASLAHEPPGWVVGDLNGDERRAQDWGFALVRMKGTHDLGELPHWHVAESFGALGAATGPAAVCMVARALARCYAHSPRCVVWLAADDGFKGALNISAAPS